MRESIPSLKSRLIIYVGLSDSFKAFVSSWTFNDSCFTEAKNLTSLYFITEREETVDSVSRVLSFSFQNRMNQG